MRGVPLGTAVALPNWLREQLSRARAVATGGAEAAFPDWKPPVWGIGDELPGSDQHLIVEHERRENHIRRTAVATAGYRTAQHIASHDPEAVVAVCDAHETILALHTPATDPDEPYPGPCAECGRPGDQYPCPTVRALGEAYSVRPGYRDEWRNDGR